MLNAVSEVVKTELQPDQRARQVSSPAVNLVCLTVVAFISGSQLERRVKSVTFEGSTLCQKEVVKREEACMIMRNRIQDLSIC